MKIISLNKIYEFEGCDDFLKDNPMIFKEILNALETDNYYYSPMSRTYTIRCYLTLEKSHKIELLLDGHIMKLTTKMLIENFYLPHELKNFICYLDGNKIIVITMWDGNLLTEHGDIAELIDTTVIPNVNPRYLICISAKNLYTLKQNYQLICCSSSYWKYIIAYSKEEDPI